MSHHLWALRGNKPGNEAGIIKLTMWNTYRENNFLSTSGHSYGLTEPVGNWFYKIYIPSTIRDSYFHEITAASVI